MSVTKAQFLEVYGRKIKNLYAWADNEEKYNKYMDAIKVCLTTEKTNWVMEGLAYEATLIELKLPKKITLTALRGLPDE